MAEAGPPIGITQELIDAFVALARGDFSVRMQRNLSRNQDDILAMFVNLIAEELARLTDERERAHLALEEGVTALSEGFVAFSGGDFSVRVERSGSGDPLDVLAFLFDNTVEEVGDLFGELGRQRELFAAMLESMIDGVLLVDAAGSVRRGNGAIARMLGLDASTLAGRTLDQLLMPDHRGLATQLRHLLDSGPIRDRDVAFRTVGGDSLVLGVNASAQRDAAGALLGMVLVARDDRALRAARAQLQMSDRLATMGTLAAGVAHEINNPLAFMVANLEFALEELAAPKLDHAGLVEIARALRSTLGGAERVRQIVRDLKAFSRFEEEVVSRVDINKLVDSAAGMVRNELRHHATLVKHYGALPPVAANEGRLLQVFLNLLQNAAQALPLGQVASNQVLVRTQRLGDGSVAVDVEDTGPGIAPEHLPRIFEAFFTTKPAGVGTGLGLSICHKIVTAAGGRIEVDSQPGQGARFRVILPAAPALAVADEAPTASRPSLRRLRVLVIDDEIEVGDAVVRILGREHDLEVVTSGAQALRLLGRQRYDVILCDLLMPQMTGMQLHERIAAAHPELSSRLVFMTGGSIEPAIRQFLERVPNLRLDKPFDVRALRALLSAAW